MANVVRATLKRRADQNFDQPGQSIQKTNRKYYIDTLYALKRSEKFTGTYPKINQTNPKKLNVFNVPDQICEITKQNLRLLLLIYLLQTSRVHIYTNTLHKR